MEVAIDDLDMGESVRAEGLNPGHVALLAEAVHQWPPIVVWGERNLVVDGHHRVAAARHLGHRSVPAVRLLGTAEDAYIESVRANLHHGLPLTLHDRRRAAHRILVHHAGWSDRRIAAMCGLSGKTVARLRSEISGAGEAGAEGGGRGGVLIDIERRIGRDGRARPIRSGDVRERIAQALDENPAGSLRSIAAAVGASPETVRSVRARRATAQTEGAPPAGAAPRAPSPLPRGNTLPAWQPDRALTSCDGADLFVRWFRDTDVRDEWRHHVWTIPVGRIYDVADEARRRAQSWSDFASMLECRGRS
jgi:ParB-like chromosome segregation protein Spo0J